MSAHSRSTSRRGVPGPTASVPVCSRTPPSWLALAVAGFLSLRQSTVPHSRACGASRHATGAHTRAALLDKAVR